MREKSRTPARLLAALAMIAFVVAFAYVLTSSEPASDAPSTDGAAEQESDLGPTQTGTGSERRRRRGGGGLPEGCYVVRTGDTLGDIATKTGVQVDALQDLNPNVDAQTLSPGQRLNLREAGCD